MTSLRVLLMSSLLIASVQPLPTTTRNYEKESAEVTETKETTDPISVQTNDSQTMLDLVTNSEGETPIEEFVLKSPKEGLTSRKGSNSEIYTITNLPTKNEDEKQVILVSSKENEIDIDKKDELNKLNITGTSKNEDLLSEAQIKRDQWLFDRQEMSSIVGGQSSYFQDAIKSIPPFPELTETIAINFPIVPNDKPKDAFAKLENFYGSSYERSLETAGPYLHPISGLIKDIDELFYV